MTDWKFRLREGITAGIDASAIRRVDCQQLSVKEIADRPMVVDGGTQQLGDCFRIHRQADGPDRLTIEGDLKNVHGIASRHDGGEFYVEGDVGHHLAAGMSGGSLTVNGSAGDFVAGPIGTDRAGMRGGTIRINGCVGHQAGHRMRRGTLLIEGSTGKMLAGSMVAGTIIVLGSTDAALATGMRRGTLILCEPGGLIAETHSHPDRYSRPMRFDAGYLWLFQDSHVAAAVERLHQLPIFRTRCDLTMGGQGEIIFPASPQFQS